MSAAVTRRAALRGSLTASLGLAAGVVPVMAMPDVVNPDATLIEFAGRVAALERRCNVLAERRGAIEDRVTGIVGFRPKMPPEPPSIDSPQKTGDYKTATHQIITISIPLASDLALAEWRTACAAAQAAYDREYKATEVRLGLPEVERRFDRMWRRLHRWYAQLAEMQPQTLPGLAAKAEPLVVLSKETSGSGNWGQVDEYAHGLALSLAHDAARLGRGGAA